MRFDRDHVKRIAALARLHLEDADLDRLALQLGQVLDHVSALEAWYEDVPAPAEAGPAGPARSDTIAFDPLARPPAALATEFTDGFFTVPLLGAFDRGPDPEEAEG